jgi:rod shape-determining protein MreD
MRSLRFLAALFGGLLLHALGTWIWGDFPRAVDVFLVVVVLHSLDGRPAASLAVGCIAGLLTDALSGGAYGLHGFADTMMGYASAVLAQRLVVRRLSSVMFLLAIVSAAQQAVLVALALLLVPGSPTPALPFVAAKVASGALLGAALFEGWNVIQARVLNWRRRRGSKLR